MFGSCFKEKEKEKEELKELKKEVEYLKKQTCTHQDDDGKPNIIYSLPSDYPFGDVKFRDTLKWHKFCLRCQKILAVFETETEMLIDKVKFIRGLADRIENKIKEKIDLSPVSTRLKFSPIHRDSHIATIIEAIENNRMGLRTLIKDIK